MAKTKGQNYMYGAAILTAGVVIMKILGFIYKVPIGNIIGDDGYSMFLATYNIYNVFLTLATAGLPVALSRMISEANAEGRPMQAKRTFSVAWWTFFVVGLVCTLVMFCFPGQLADSVLLAYRPGVTCGAQAVADALFGETPITGRTPFQIPRSMEQVLAQREDMPKDIEDPLVDYGFGIDVARFGE